MLLVRPARATSTAIHDSPPQDKSGHTWHHPDSSLLVISANSGDAALN